MIQASPSLDCVGSRSWHHPYHAGFAGVTEASPRFQRKACKVRQHISDLEFLQASPKGVIHESERVKPKLQWRSQIDIPATWNACQGKLLAVFKASLRQ